MYLPLEYVKRYSVLTELYCSEEYINCEPEVLLEMIADADWGTSNYSGPNKERYNCSHAPRLSPIGVLYRLGMSRLPFSA